MPPPPPTHPQTLSLSFPLSYPSFQAEREEAGCLLSDIVWLSLSSISPGTTFDIQQVQQRLFLKAVVYFTSAIFTLSRSCLFPTRKRFERRRRRRRKGRRRRQVAAIPRDGDVVESTLDRSGHSTRTTVRPALLERLDDASICTTSGSCTDAGCGPNNTAQ